MLVEDELEAQADWRRQKALEYPNDRQNVDAAELFGKLAKEALELDRSDPLLNSLDRLLERLQGDAMARFVERRGEYHRQIGFSVFPSTVREYLQGLIEIAR